MTRGFKDEDTVDEGVDVGEVQLVKETDQAILICMLDTGIQVWVPKSVLIADPGREGSVGVLILKTWWHDKHWEETGQSKDVKKAKPSSKAIGVSDLAQVQKLLEGKGITRITFDKHRVIVVRQVGDPSTMACATAHEGKDLTEAVRALDKARRE